jgi:hypothetical protein
MKAAALEVAKEQAAETKRQNEQRIAARSAAEAQQRKRDEALMQETIKWVAVVWRQGGLAGWMDGGLLDWVQSLWHRVLCSWCSCRELHAAALHAWTCAQASQWCASACCRCSSTSAMQPATSWPSPAVSEECRVAEFNISE